MSKAPATQQEDGEPSSRARRANAATPQEYGEPSSRAREGDTAAPSQPPGTRRGRHASERQAVQAALYDGAGTSAAAAMAAHGGHDRHVKLKLPSEEGGLQYPGGRQDRASGGQDHPPGHGDARGRSQVHFMVSQDTNGSWQTPQEPTATAGRPRPYYVPPSRARQEQQHPPPYSVRPPRQAFDQPPAYAPYPGGGFAGERLASTLPPQAGALPPQAGARPPGMGVGDPSVLEEPIRPKKKVVMWKKPSFKGKPVPPPAPHQLIPGQAALPGEDNNLPAGGGRLPHSKTIERVSTLPMGEDSLAAPPGGGGHATAPGGVPPRGRTSSVPHAKTIERVSTLPVGEDSLAAPPGGPGGATAPGGVPPRGKVGGVPHVGWVGETVPAAARDHDRYPPTAREHDMYQHPHPQQETDPYARPWKEHGRTVMGQPSPSLLPQRKKKRRPLAVCFTLCCILFWLLVVGLGVAILVVYLLYHPQSPRLRVTTATLNAGYIDELPPPRGGLALNSDLYALATIYNPNTKVDVLMRYMQLDLYFRGVMIGTTAVWPIHEEPGESVLRNVHLVVSEVGISREDAETWHNATTRYGLVELKLKARFHVQLNFGRWLPFRYWVYPSCSLWLDPPPGGALRRARCRKSD